MCTRFFVIITPPVSSRDCRHTTKTFCEMEEFREKKWDSIEDPAEEEKAAAAAAAAAEPAPAAGSSKTWVGDGQTSTFTGTSPSYDPSKPTARKLQSSKPGDKFDFEHFMGNAKTWTDDEREQYCDDLGELPLFADGEEEGAEGGTFDAMQALIDEGESDHTLAQHWKDKGNEMMLKVKSLKNKGYYHSAREYYTTAVDYCEKAIAPPMQPHQSTRELYSTILSNRAQVNLEFKNYGRCRKDCVAAIDQNRQNTKAYFRAAKASEALRK